MNLSHPPRTLTAGEEMRLCLGFVVLPFVVGVVAFVGFPILAFGRDFGFDPDPTRTAISVAGGTFMFALGFTLVCVVPAAIWILKRRAVTFGRALLFGLALGNLPVAIAGLASAVQRLFLAASSPANLWAAIGTVGFASLLGLTGAAVFWAISIRGHDFSHDANRSH